MKNSVLFAVALLLLVAPWGEAEEMTGSLSCRILPGPYEILDKDGRHEIRLEGFGVLGETGAPRLPGKIFSVAIPPGAQATSVQVKAAPPVRLDGLFNIPPSPLPRVIGMENPEVHAKQHAEWLATRERVYGSDLPYPASAGHLVRRSGFRKYNLLDVRLTPFQYCPQSGQLRFYPMLTIEVEYTFPQGCGNVSPMADFSPRMERLAREIIVNYDEAQAWYADADSSRSRAIADFVIITTDAMTSAVTPLVEHETAKGRSPVVVTLEWINANYTGYDDAARMRNFLRDKYPTSQWGIEDVLLVGTYSQLLPRECWVDIGYGRPWTDFYFAELSHTDANSWDADGDHRYAEDGDDQVDLYSEINVGRIPWTDAALVQHICEKSVAYELNTDPSFKKNILVAGTFFWADTDTAVLMEAKVDQPWMSDWTITRMYEDNATVSTTYAYDYEVSPGSLISVWSSGTYAFVNTAGHGSPTSAHQMGYGSSAYMQTSDCSQLNDNYPAIVWADSCSTADPSYANLGREMMAQGAVGYVGSAKPAYGSGGWTGPEDGSSQSCDYWFTAKVTSAEMPQGEAHQWAMRKLYTDGLWYNPTYEMYEWTMLGNPNLGMGPMPVTSTIQSALTCNPSSGILPFSSQMQIWLSNLHAGQTRRMAARIDVTLGNGAFYSNWRSGYSNISGGGVFAQQWPTNFPDVPAVLGINEFLLVAEDVTPAPFNQSPYPSSGDTDTSGCTVLGMAP